MIWSLSTVLAAAASFWLQLPLSPLPQDPAAVASGHLVLLVQGDARGLTVSHVFAKADPYAKPRDRAEAHQVAVLDAAGRELGVYPLDLSPFDLDPARVGQPPRVEGDRVIATRVVALVNVPRLRDGVRLEIRRDRVVVGRVAPDRYARLLADADKRVTDSDRRGGK
ncbi:MAG: hypothetical protein AAF628_34865 [Planctomycetota bacterium]